MGWFYLIPEMVFFAFAVVSYCIRRDVSEAAFCIGMALPFLIKLQWI
jgi:hypothetical protein